MNEQEYKATLNRSKNRAGWCVIFRHPLRLTNAGKPGLRVRRGLGTTDEKEATRLVNQLNSILSDKSLWNPGAREAAATRFDEPVVKAFYEKVTPAHRDSWAIRQELMPLPTIEDGYVRAMLLGTTGAGKTTVVRQLIGTDPNRERFPSVSAAKTTICNIEIVPRVGDYQAAITFLPRDHVRLAIEECVVDAAVAHLDARRPGSMVQRFLEHVDQRFRLSYLLGTLDAHPAAGLGDDLEDEELTDGPADETTPTEEAIPELERDELQAKLADYISRITTLADESFTALKSELSLTDSEIKKDQDTLQELVEEHLQDTPAFAALVDEILDDVETRFDHIEQGCIEAGPDGWPVHWQFTSSDRKLFLKTVNRFSSNYKPQFGRLLTPLVEGIRVAGPFTPDWTADNAPLPIVLIDGEGLGHTANSAASISTAVTKRYEDVDVVMLVDNAAQPMQAAPGAVLRSLASSGHESKLVIAFTHFDAVVGDNLGRKSSARKAHVLSSLENVISNIGQTLSKQAENSLRRSTEGRVIFLSNIQDRIPATAGLTLSELVKLINTAKDVGTPPPPSETTPIYDDANMVLCIQQALQDFHEPWRARLGLPSRSRISAEHWARIKALSRRLGVLGEDEYHILRPVADLIAQLQEHISVFIGTPLSWDPTNAPEEVCQGALDAVSRSVFTTLHEFCSSRIFLNRVPDWSQAYSHRGTGSTRVRARDIRGIYDSAAPVPGEVPAADSNEFLIEIRKLLTRAIEDGGGKFHRP